MSTYPNLPPVIPYSRPLNPYDNATTAPGLFSYPNGSYVANPYPTTAAIGGTGAYGAMLPTKINNFTRNPFNISQLQGVKNMFSSLFNTNKGVSQYAAPVGPPAPRGAGLPPGYDLGGRVSRPPVIVGGRGSMIPTQQNANAYSALTPRPNTGAKPTYSDLAAAVGHFTSSMDLASGNLPAYVSIASAQSTGNMEDLLALGYTVNNGVLQAPQTGTSATSTTTGGGNAPWWLNNPNVSKREQTERQQYENYLNRSVAQKLEDKHKSNAYARHARNQSAQYQAQQQAAVQAQQQAAAQTPVQPQWTQSYGLINFNTATG